MEERDPRRSREHSEQLPQKKKARNSSSAKQDAASKSSIDFILNDDPDPTSSCSGGQRSGEQESKPNSGTKSSSGGSAELEETSSEVSSDNSDRGKNNASQHPQTTHRSSSSAYGATSSSTERDSPSASILQIQPCACSSLEVTGNDFSQVHGSSLPSVSNQTHPQASVAPAMESAVYNQSDGPDEIEVQENSSPRTTSNGPRMSASRGGSSSDGERGFTCSQCNKAFKERGNVSIRVILLLSSHYGLSCSQLLEYSLLLFSRF